MFFIIIIGILFIILGLLVCLRYRIKYSSYRTYTANVLGYRTRTEKIGDTEQEYFCVVVSYRKGSEDIHADYISYVPAETVPCKRGDIISVDVSSASPKTFLYSDEVIGTSGFGAAMIIGGLLTVGFHLLYRFS